MHNRPYSMTAYQRQLCRELTDEEWALQSQAIRWALKKGLPASKIATISPNELCQSKISFRTKQGRAKQIKIDNSPLRWWGFLSKNYFLSKRYAFIKGAGKRIRCQRCLPGLKTSEIESVLRQRKMHKNIWKIEGVCGRIGVSLTLTSNGSREVV